MLVKRDILEYHESLLRAFINNMRFRRRRFWLVSVTSVILSSGCAGMAPAQVGQTAGTIVGAVIAPGIGPPLGALAGLLGGMLVQGEMDKVTEKRERKTLGDQLGSRSPGPPEETAPSRGVPTRVWVDETVQGGRLIAGHFEARSLL